MYSSSAYQQHSVGQTGYRRTGTNTTSGLPPSNTRTTTNNSIPNRSSFNGGSSTYGKDPSSQKTTSTTLAHAARNGVIGAGSSIKSNGSNNMRTTGGSAYSGYGASATNMRTQSRGKIGSRPSYDKSGGSGMSQGSAYANQQRGSFATGSNVGQGYSRHQNDDEETKVRSSGSRIQPGGSNNGGSSQASIYVRPGQRQGASNFGDFTGNVKNFSMPEEDQMSSRAHLKRTTEEPSTDFAQLDLKKGQSQNVGILNKSSHLAAATNPSKLQRRASQPDDLGLSQSSASFEPCGLRNIGNTCFMNSILQPLLASPYLNDYFLNHFQSERHHRQTRLAETYYELLRSCRNSSGSAVTPSAIKNAVSRTVSQFSGYGQQDSQEFMRFLIDRMHDELNRVTTKPAYRELNFQNLPIEEQSEEWSRYYKARDNSIMSDLFEGQLINRTSCLSCDFQDCAFDNFMDLSVEIPRKAVRYLGSIKLSECLDKFIEPEKMLQTGFKCSSCKRKVDIQKDLTIYRFPKILVIHLKRFYHSAMRREKLNTTVSFPQTLDMSAYAPHSNHASKRHATQYQLYGITHHSGSLYGGHYISEVYNFGDKRWYECNDSHVRKQSHPDTSSSSAYVLFYVMKQ